MNMNRLLTFPKENVEKRGDHNLSGERVLSNHPAHGENQKENQGKISQPLFTSKMNRFLALVRENVERRDHGPFGERVLSNHPAHGENQGKISQSIFISKMNQLLASAKENVEKRGDHSLSGERALRNHPAHGENQRENQGEMNHLTNQTDMIHFHNPTDIIKSDPGHGNAPEKTLAGGTSSNPDSMKENYFHNNGQEVTSLVMSHGERVLSNHPAHSENQGKISQPVFISKMNRLLALAKENVEKRGDHSLSGERALRNHPAHGENQRENQEKTLAGGTSSNPDSMKENYFHNKGKRVLSNHPTHGENQGEINQLLFSSKMNRLLALAKENVEKRGDHGFSGERVQSNHPAHGENQETTLAGGASSNHDSMKENNFHNNGQEVTPLMMSPNHSAPRNNNVSQAPLVQPARTMSSVAQKDIPFYYMVPPDNLTSRAPRACKTANQQFGTGNSESFTVTFSTSPKDQIPPPQDTNPSYPFSVTATGASVAGYHLNEVAPINGSSPFYGGDINRFNGLNNPNAVDLSPSTPIDHVGSFGYSVPNISNNNIRDKANKQKVGEVEENSMLLRPLKRRNINIFPPTHGERELLPNTDLLLFAKDVNVGDIGAIPSQNKAIPSQNEARCVPSTSDGTNYGKEKDEDDLDLSLHL